MRHGSLFSGIGGWDYAAEQLGWTNLFHCEWIVFCQEILKFYWPEAESFSDITKTDFTKYANRIDVLSGSCPCQPFSVAGKRKGSKDDRNLWSQMYRAIREIKPRWVCYENVSGLLTIESGMVFEQVCADLENEGYEVQPFIIPACAKDAVHRRDRVWIVATDNPEQGLERNAGTKLFKQCEGFTSDIEHATDTERPRLEGCITERNTSAERRDSKHIVSNENWLEAATRLCSVDDGTPGRLDTTAISKGKWRTESLKAYGNAIYWPIAYEIFKAIENYAEKMD